MRHPAQSYDYTLEKVKMYTRVPLGDIVGITKGKLFVHRFVVGRSPVFKERTFSLP